MISNIIMILSNVHFQNLIFTLKISIKIYLLSLKKVIIITNNASLTFYLLKCYTHFYLKRLISSRIFLFNFSNMVFKGFLCFFKC